MGRGVFVFMTLFEELDHAQTDLGELILRRRVTTQGIEVFEVKPDGTFLMSSLINDSEIALAEIGLDKVEGTELRIAIGELGLGHTAAASLDHPGVESVVVVEVLSEVIAWHTKEFVPLAPRLTGDPRCTLVNADFYDWLSESNDRFHAILVDIDHSPDNLLSDAHRSFYEPDGLDRVREKLHPGGVFALWSGDLPSESFIAKLESTFAAVSDHPVNFRNPLLDIDDTNTIYIAQSES